MSEEVKISIVLLTYNQEKYIGKALESIVNQKTNFKFEVIVGEDKSTDNTRKVIREYAMRYPELVKPVFRKKNLGTSRNLVSVLQRCKGKYIAFLEGDDYWTDMLKLQKQYDFLEQNKDYSGVMTDVTVVNKYDRQTLNAPKVLDHELSKPIDYVKTMYPNNQFKFIGCFMMRNYLSEGKYNQYLLYTQIVTDLTIEAIAIKHGKIGFLPERMAAYRWVPSHGNNYSSMAKDTLCRDRIKSFQMVIKLLPKETHKWVYMRISRDYWELLHNYLVREDYKAVLKMFLKEMSCNERIYYIVYHMRRKLTGVS